MRGKNCQELEKNRDLHGKDKHAFFLSQEAP